MWALLRGRRFRGLKFRRQYPVRPFILDFFCTELGWAIELDGGQHNTADARARDDGRSDHLARCGITVTRFWNNHVTGELNGVLEQMWEVSTQLMHQRQHPHPGPLPRGEGEETDVTLLQREGGETDVTLPKGEDGNKGAPLS